VRAIKDLTGSVGSYRCCVRIAPIGIHGSEVHGSLPFWYCVLTLAFQWIHALSPSDFRHLLSETLFETTHGFGSNSMRRAVIRRDDAGVRFTRSRSSMRAVGAQKVRPSLRPPLCTSPNSSLVILSHFQVRSKPQNSLLIVYDSACNGAFNAIKNGILDTLPPSAPPGRVPTLAMYSHLTLCRRVVCALGHIFW
jgi:hypothetical protein